MLLLLLVLVVAPTAVLLGCAIGDWNVIKLQIIVIVGRRRGPPLPRLVAHAHSVNGKFQANGVGFFTLVVGGGGGPAALRETPQKGVDFRNGQIAKCAAAVVVIVVAIVIILVFLSTGKLTSIFHCCSSSSIPVGMSRRSKGPLHLPRPLARLSSSKGHRRRQSGEPGPHGRVVIGSNTVVSLQLPIHGRHSPVVAVLAGVVALLEEGGQAGGVRQQ